MGAEPMVSIRDCRCRLGRSGDRWVSFQVDELNVAAGERAAVCGPSGCGKSTLLNLVSGLLRPDGGTVRVLGTAVNELPPGEADVFRGRTIGYVFQTFNLLPGFSVLDNVLVGMRFGRSVPRAERRPRAREVLGRVGLGDRLEARPDRLSVGERQRVAIARAAAGRPALLLADEPTGALDPETGEEVLRLLLELCDERGCTLLLVTHDEALAARLPRRIDGRSWIRWEGAP